jgi:hypothetical protein
MSAVRVTSRLIAIRHHIGALTVPTQNWGYTIQMDVHHTDKIINFVTESMSVDDKMEVFQRQKMLMREMYPEYIITERHL